MLFTVVAYWMIGLPLGYSLGIRLDYGAKGMWIGLIGGLSIAAILMIGRFLRLSAAGRLHAHQLQHQQHER
jgi:MATE family multidrug resistance protein